MVELTRRFRRFCGTVQVLFVLSPDTFIRSWFLSDWINVDSDGSRSEDN